MALSRVKTIDKIKALLTEMQPLMTKGKLRENYFHIHEDATQLPAAIVREALQWLVAVYQDTYIKVLKVWKLCPEEVWKRYETFKDFGAHAEVILLNQKLAAYRAQMHKRPVFFVKRKVNAIIKRQSKD